VDNENKEKNKDAKVNALLLEKDKEALIAH